MSKQPESLADLLLEILSDIADEIAEEGRKAGSVDMNRTAAAIRRVVKRKREE